jgi:hypothetical protein
MRGFQWKVNLKWIIHKLWPTAVFVRFRTEQRVKKGTEYSYLEIILTNKQLFKPYSCNNNDSPPCYPTPDRGKALILLTDVVCLRNVNPTLYGEFGGRLWTKLNSFDKRNIFFVEKKHISVKLLYFHDCKPPGLIKISGISLTFCWLLRLFRGAHSACYMYIYTLYTIVRSVLCMHTTRTVADDRILYPIVHFVSGLGQNKSPPICNFEYILLNFQYIIKK